MKLETLQRIKRWHVAHRHDHPVEYQLWDVMLTVWVMGWIGWVPASAFGDYWIYPLCALGIAAPGLYVHWRRRAHRARRLRCDWVHVSD